MADAIGFNPRSDGRLGLTAYFVAGTVSSCLSAVITMWTEDDASGFCCGAWMISQSKEA